MVLLIDPPTQSTTKIDFIKDMTYHQRHKTKHTIDMLFVSLGIRWWYERPQILISDP